VDNIKNRERNIINTSIIGIVTNLVLALLKAIIGYLSGSIAIISDSVNNLTDSSSSLITIIGTKLAQKQPDKKHPFGYGRVEYLTSLIIGIIVLVTGVEMLINSVKNIINPSEVNYSMITLVILAFTVAAKVILGIFTKKKGLTLDSGALVASGKDALNDAVISSVTIITALIYILTKVSIDSYAGLLISMFIIAAGFNVLGETLSKILGERTNQELRNEIIRIVEASESVMGAHDLILNNYGPNSYLGSVNVEIDHKKTVGDIYVELHHLQIMIYKSCGVYLIFGIYAIDEESAISKRLWKILMDFKESETHCLGCHGVVIDENKKQIFCDAVLDFDCEREEIIKN
jgi:cation diffusion facilitator family transporter